MFRIVLLVTISGLIRFLCEAASLSPDTTTGGTVATTQHHHHHHTHRPHVTREPSENGIATFQYDHYCHLMAYMAGHKTCYIYAIHPDDRHLVHTESGMLLLEVRIMTLSINATEPYSRDDLVVRSGMLARLCPDTYTLIDLN
ncbi:uncharacterized protein LOC128185801 [Crassostrea angulata]|uniref:uncharacterized protein LOC128185801 n=1 Tax=Magallana angulata TaxID=2784310 RepID=UPI0022B1C0B6|nr:uncharacterized protein LOC128185801 [Crassostrea angulata]